MNPVFQALADQVAATTAAEAKAIEFIHNHPSGATPEEIQAVTDAAAALKTSQDALDAVTV